MEYVLIILHEYNGEEGNYGAERLSFDSQEELNDSITEYALKRDCAIVFAGLIKEEYSFNTIVEIETIT